MERIGIRDLRRTAAATVRRAGAGRRIVITVAGRPVAQLGPVEPVSGEPSIDDLVVRGLLVRARRSDRPGPELDVPMWAGSRLDRLLVEVRGR